MDLVWTTIVLHATLGIPVAHMRSIIVLGWSRFNLRLRSPNSEERYIGAADNLAAAGCQRLTISRSALARVIEPTGRPGPEFAKGRRDCGASRIGTLRPS